MTRVDSKSTGEERAPIRVLQALTTTEFGGTELMVLRLVRQLTGSRVASEVSVLDGPGAAAAAFRALGVPLYDLSGPGGLPGALWRFLHVTRGRRFHVLHLYGFRMSLVGCLAALLLRPSPVVLHGIRGLHVTEGEDVDAAWTRVALGIERLGAGLIDVYVANSRGAAAFLVQRGVPRGKLRVIPNGIDAAEWEGPRRPAASTAILVCVAGFRPLKWWPACRSWAPTCRASATWWWTG